MKTNSRYSGVDTLDEPILKTIVGDPARDDNYVSLTCAHYRAVISSLSTTSSSKFYTHGEALAVKFSGLLRAINAARSRSDVLRFPQGLGSLGSVASVRFAWYNVEYKCVHAMIDRQSCY